MPTDERPSSPRPSLPSVAHPTEAMGQMHRTAESSLGKIAVISDIHSNLHALEAVFTECTLRDIQRFFCLGDIVGYAAFPSECLSAIRHLKCPTVLGNHDQYVARGAPAYNLNFMARAGIEYSVNRLKPAAREWLASLPAVLTEERTTLVHASLDEPLAWNYILCAADAEYSFPRQRTPVCFYGHTHIPKLYTEEGKQQPEPLERNRFRLDPEGRYHINPGSVGQPRGGGDPRAQFLVFDPADLTVEFVRVEYNIDAAAQAIREAGLPAMLANRLYEGL